jgi:hypothetical protein
MADNSEEDYDVFTKNTDTDVKVSEISRRDNCLMIATPVPTRNTDLFLTYVNIIKNKPPFCVTPQTW